MFLTFYLFCQRFFFKFCFHFFLSNTCRPARQSIVTVVCVSACNCKPRNYGWSGHGLHVCPTILVTHLVLVVGRVLREIHIPEQNPHSGMSGGGWPMTPHVSGVYSVTVCIMRRFFYWYINNRNVALRMWPNAELQYILSKEASKATLTSILTLVVWPYPEVEWGQ